MEEWERWFPTNDIPSVIYNDKLIDDDNGITIKFSNEYDTKNIIVAFDGNVLSYRNTDEGSLLKKIDFLDDRYGTKFYSEWSLFKAKGTDYINWFLEESSGIYKAEEVQHYIFVTPHDVIEVLSKDPPNVKIEQL